MYASGLIFTLALLLVQTGPTRDFCADCPDLPRYVGFWGPASRTRARGTLYLAHLPLLLHITSSGVSPEFCNLPPPPL